MAQYTGLKPEETWVPTNAEDMRLLSARHAWVMIIGHKVRRHSDVETVTHMQKPH